MDPELSSRTLLEPFWAVQRLTWLRCQRRCTESCRGERGDIPGFPLAAAKAAWELETPRLKAELTRRDVDGLADINMVGVGLLQLQSTSLDRAP